MREVQNLSRSELENYAKQLEQEKKLLLEAVDLAEEHINSSTGTHKALLEKIQQVQRDASPDRATYDTTGIEEAMDELRNTVDESTEKLSDIEENDFDQ